MAEKKNGSNGKGCVIIRGYKFGEDSGSWEALPEGYGVIVVCRYGQIVAYGDIWNRKYPHEQDVLEKNFTGAKMQHGDQAFLVKRENGILICQREKLPKVQPKMPSIVPAWKRDRWHNFDQAGEVAARRGGG